MQALAPDQQPSSADLPWDFIFLGDLCARSALKKIKQKTPTFWRESWGLVNPQKYPPFPAEGLRDQRE
jgi:hypothetical protein